MSMLTCTIEEQMAIPIRALPFITGFEPVEIAHLFYDPESNASMAMGPPRSYCVDKAGTVARVPASRWKPVRKRILALEQLAADPLQLVKALPAGTFVWWTEFKTYHDSLIDDVDEGVMRGFQIAPAGEWGWDEAAPLSAEQADVVWEGFEGFMPVPIGKPGTKSKNSRAKHLETLGQEIEEILSEAKSKGMTIDKTAMPGEKVDLIDILKTRKSTRAGRADSTYFDDFSALGLRWLGGRNRSDRTPFLNCFGLKPRVI